MENYEHYHARYPFNTLIDIFVQSIQDVLESQTDTDKLEKAVLFVKDNMLYPDRKRIKQLFSLSIAAYNKIPEGNSKQRYYTICNHLNDILLKVLMSK